MLIISVRDNKNNRWKRRQKTKKEKNKGVTQAIVKVWELNDCAVFNVGFLQLICKASLIFKLNLEPALSIILKERQLHESKNVAVECRCLKIWDLSFLICSSMPVLKWLQVSQI